MLDDMTNMPHLTYLEIMTPVIAEAVLRAAWLAPDWGLKVLELMEAIRRFRR